MPSPATHTLHHSFLKTKNKTHKEKRTSEAVKPSLKHKPIYLEEVPNPRASVTGQAMNSDH